MVISLALDLIRQPNPNEKAINSSYQTIKQQSVSFSSGDATIVYFWGTWCGVCSVVSPKINQLQKDGYPIMTVALSSGSNAEIQQYLHKKHYQFDVINDENYNDQLSQDWQIGAVPMIAIVKNGKLIHGMTGFHTALDIKMRYWLIHTVMN